MFWKKLLILFFVLFVSFLLPSCTSYTWVKVVQKSQAKTMNSTNPEVTETDQFNKIIGQTKKIAYKPPDICHSESAGKATGQVSSAHELMSTSCGVWLAELERAFAKRNYEVISWKSIDSGYDQAKKRGVRVLLLINSLEHGVSSATNEENIEWNFYESDDKGTQVAPLAVKKSWRDQIMRITPKGAYVPERYLSAVVDVTAVDLETNQSIWFFRQVLIKKVKDEQQWDGLFYCYERQDVCYRYEEGVDPKTAKDAEMASKVVITKETGNQASNLYKQETYQLVREIVGNLANGFIPTKRN